MDDSGATYTIGAIIVALVALAIQIFVIALFVYLVVRKALKDDRKSQLKIVAPVSTVTI